MNYGLKYSMNGIKMNVRYINKPIHGVSSKFNTAGIGEVVVYFPEGDATSEFIRELQVELSDGSWKDMSKAFRDKTLIPDIYNTCFMESRTDEEREKGYYL